MTPERREELFKIGLLQISQELHMSLTGAYQDLTLEAEREYFKYISYRLNHWKPSASPYDQAVNRLLHTVHREYMFARDVPSREAGV